LNTLVACLGAHVNDTRAAIEFRDQALTLAEELELPEEILRSYINGSDSLDQGGRVEEAAELALAGAERARELGLERHPGHLLEAEAASRFLRLGRWDEAIRLADRVLATATNVLARTSAKDTRATIAMERGDFALAHEVLADASSTVSEHGGSMWLSE